MVRTQDDRAAFFRCLGDNMSGARQAHLAFGFALGEEVGTGRGGAAVLCIRAALLREFAARADIDSSFARERFGVRPSEPLGARGVARRNHGGDLVGLVLGAAGGDEPIAEMLEDRLCGLVSCRDVDICLPRSSGTDWPPKRAPLMRLPVMVVTSGCAFKYCRSTSRTAAGPSWF
jgi:hypothetical protein